MTSPGFAKAIAAYGARLSRAVVQTGSAEPTKAGPAHTGRMRWSSAPPRPIASTTKPVGAPLKAASVGGSTRGQSWGIVSGAGSAIWAPLEGGEGEGRTRLRIEEVE